MRQLHALSMNLIPMMLFRQSRPKQREWPNGVRGRRNPMKRLESRKEGAWIFLPPGLDFPSPGLDFPSLRLGFSFPRFARKENSAVPRNSMNNNVNSTYVNAVGRRMRGGGPIGELPRIALCAHFARRSMANSAAGRSTTPTREGTMRSPDLLAIAAAAAFFGATAATSAADRRFSSDAARRSKGGLSRLAQWERPKAG